MSRGEIGGDKYTIAFGVDHVTGAFVQLWVNPIDEQDCAAVIIDSFGVRVEEEQMSALDEKTLRYVDEQRKRFEIWHKSGRSGLPNIDTDVAIGLAKSIEGFPDITTEVYKAFD